MKSMKYAMLFVLTPDLENVLLLLKPWAHPNPIFRDKWTAPGGHIEEGESELDGALREMWEETGLTFRQDEVRFVLNFACNCDPTESEHEVFVYAATAPIEKLNRAVGDTNEPISVWRGLPPNTLWYVSPLMDLIKGRLKQPIYVEASSLERAIST